MTFSMASHFLPNFVYEYMKSWLFRERDYDDDDVKRCNEFIDDFLRDFVDERGDEYDPYNVEDSKIGFSKKIVFANVSGEAKLTNGYIRGLKTLHRPDHCSMKENESRLKVKALLGAGVLTLHQVGSVKFMNFGPSITVEGIVSYIEVLMEFTVDAKTGREGKLQEFKIEDMRGMKATVSGLGPLNWAVNPIISGVTKIFKGFIKNLMERKVKDHIEERLPKYQFPVRNADETTSQDNTVSSAETSEPSTTAEEKQFITSDATSESEVSTMEKVLTEEETSKTTDEEPLVTDEISKLLGVSNEETLVAEKEIPEARVIMEED